MKKLDHEFFFRKFKDVLCREFGKEEGLGLWKEAGLEYERLFSENPSLKSHKGVMAVPCVALYRVLRKNGKDAEELLNAYGRMMGKKFAKAVHVFTSVPGIHRILWKHIDRIVDNASSEQKGYTRRIVSEPPVMYGVDILSCPYHDVCKELGSEKAALCICSMDKEYMKGFRHIRYERTGSVAEGAECCDYRLRLDKDK